MTRITALEPNAAPAASRTLLDAAQKKMGMVPNLLKGLAHSPAALDASMSMSSSLGTGALSPQLREQVALATAGVNGCDYCASAHTAIGKGLRIDEAELQRNLVGESSDRATGAALDFVTSVIKTRGHITDEQLASVRTAGFSDGQITELVGHIALNTFTNYFNHVAQTELDFPPVAARACTAGACNA